ncbi:MAG: hypothetical protein GX677_05440 [Treponema sp.]|nr:hypothetical protein [Treponema sp.]
MNEIRKVTLKKAMCAVDLGDGSERGLYVNQDYILEKMKRIHRGISLMYTYYPKDESWPVRASIAHPQKVPSGAWDYPYEDYFPYRGGVEGKTDDEPFVFMKEIRQRGQDVVLTMTIDPKLTREDLILVAKDLRCYGRVFLRVNHECTGGWFCFTKRATYPELADFFVLVSNVMHEYAPNVRMILCAGMFDEAAQKIEMEDIFLEAYKVADYWSGDKYLSLNWGWPVEVAKKNGKQFICYNVDEVYDCAKKTWKRLKEITGQDKRMLLSELNADGDVTGAYEQANMMKHFMEKLRKDKENWLSGFTMYQFRDDGRLGLEITNPNNKEVGIEQPILSVYRDEILKEYFNPKIEVGEQIKFPYMLRWGNSEDADGLEVSVKVDKDPHYAELYFGEDSIDSNLMIELNGYWFYKKSGVKCIDLMSYFYNNKIKKNSEIKLRFFAPPKTGLNEENDNYDWQNNYFTEINSLPEIRIETEPVSLVKHYKD